MAETLKQRLIGFLDGEDEALNALGGGSPRQTISGTLGRGLIRKKWWASSLVAIVNAGAYLIAGQKNHCQTVAADEASRSP